MPEKVENMAANKDKALSANNVFYTFLDIANIACISEDSSKSFVSSCFTSRKRNSFTVGDKVVDFDVL